MYPSTAAPASSSTSVTRLNAFDAQAMVLALQQGFLEHVQLEKGRFGGQIVHSVSPQCRTDWGQYNLALLAQGDLSPEWLSVGIFLHGHGVWRVQGQELRNGDLVVYAPGRDMCVSLPPQAQWVGVQMPPHKLQTLGLHMPPGVSALHLPGQLSPQALQQLAELSSVLGPNRQQDLDVALVDQAHEQLQQILWVELAKRWRQPSSSAALSLQTRERLMQSVDQWVQDNSTTPLRIDALCEALDVPIWQLERAFLQTYGLAPQRLITLRRLAKARRALQLQTGSVTEVAMGHGFWHLGRFAGLYKNYYGESPSETLRASGHISDAGAANMAHFRASWPEL